MTSARAGFEALVAAHAREVARVCGAVLRDPHLAADAAQETFLRLWRRMRAEGAPAAAGGWLRRAALSSAIDLRRRRRAGTAFVALAETSAGEDPPGLAAAHDPAQDAAARELDERLAAALETLPEGQRTVFLLRHAGGMSLAEAAETLGLALSTVKTHFARAVLKLQARLSAFDDAHVSRADDHEPRSDR